MVVDKGDGAFVADEELGDLAEARGAARVHYHRVLQLSRARPPQLELGEAQLGVGQETAHRGLLGARKENPRTGIEAQRTHRRREGVEVRREVGGDDTHMAIVGRNSEFGIRN